MLKKLLTTLAPQFIFSSANRDFNHLLIILSDIEMGAGGVTDDFPQSDFLANLLEQYNTRHYRDLKIDLVFNGDTFDFLKTSVNNCYPHHIDKNIALAKFNRILEFHKIFFEGVHKFIKYNPLQRQVHFIVGNHDAELLFKNVQHAIANEIGYHANIHFPGFVLNIGPVHIEHGSQHDSLFRMDPEHPFIEHQGRTLLNIPWGVVPLLDVIMPHQHQFYHLDRIKPRQQLLEMLPEMKEWLTSAFWKYWTQDFYRKFVKTDDPFKKITWPMLKEVARRFRFLDPDVSIGDYFFRQVRSDEGAQIYVLGHMHSPSLWSYGNRKIMQTGCFRNEFMISSDGKELTPIAKSLAKIYLKDMTVIRAKLTEVSSPEMPPDYVPKTDIQEFKPVILDLLGSTEDRKKQKLEMEKAEKNISKQTSNKTDLPT